MKGDARRRRIWRLLYCAVHGYICRKFALESEPCAAEGTCLVISNHVTNWDPLLVAMSFPRLNMHYVASEHIFRRGIASALLRWALAPIARKKGGSGAETVREILRHTRDGHSVCLFAEGDCCWDGVSGSIFPATGKLARSSGATLVTYRLEGGYFTAPRWGRGVRRGKMRGHAVGIYPPEKLRELSGEEITALIERDIYENAWERQARERVSFAGKAPAELLETALFMCPRCGRIGTLKSGGDMLRCLECGFAEAYRSDGYFTPGEPFASIAEWDRWQHVALAERRPCADGEWFSDGVVSFKRILAGHRAEKLEGERIVQLGDRLRCGGLDFPLAEIESMAMVKRDILLFSVGAEYYELKAAQGCNLRKYLAVWKNSAGAAKK